MNKFETKYFISPWIATILYVIFGFIWIMFSDQLLLSMLNNPELITFAQSMKGFVFVAVGGILIFIFIQKGNKIAEEYTNELKLRENKFVATIEQAPLGIVHHRTNEQMFETNKAMHEMLGYTREEFLKLNFEEFIHPEDLNNGRDLDRKLSQGKIKSFSIEKRYIRKDGSQFYGMVRKAAVYSEKNEPLFIVTFLEDISELKRNEEKIRKSLKEKEVLLSEIHHRVKNNLALISALFELQTVFADDQDVYSILEKSTKRIKTLSMIHETFSESNSSGSINFSECLTQLIDYLKLGLNSKGGEVKIDWDIDSVHMNINLATPVSLICTELLINSNSAKFNEIENSVIFISMNEDSENITLKISDNGKGTFKKHEVTNTSALTYIIVTKLVDQIEGKLKTKTEKEGVSFVLTFPKNKTRGPSSTLT
ncbi:MAG: PAS domain S-box protein [Balneolaceae bacterium]